MRDISLKTGQKRNVIISADGSVTHSAITVELELDLTNTALGDGTRVRDVSVEGFVLGDTVSSLDEPLHGIDLVAAVHATPLLGVLDGLVDERIVLDAPLQAVVLSGTTVLDLDGGEALGIRVGETLHDGTLDNGLPGVGGLHDHGRSVNGIAETLLEISRGTETTDEQNSLDGHVGGGNLVLDKLDDLKNDWLKDGLEVGGLESETTTGNTESTVVGKTSNGNGVGVVGGGVEGELTLDLLLEDFHSLS